MEHQEQLNDLLADKLALDNMFGQSIKELHETRKQLLLKTSSLQSLVEQNNVLLGEKAELQKKVDELQHSLSVIQSEREIGG